MSLMPSIKMRIKPARIVPCLLTASLCLSVVACASAEQEQPISFAGTGCPADSALPDTITDQEERIFRIRFDQYDAGKSAKSGQKNRAACSFALPVNVQEGYRVVLTEVIWYGKVSGTATLNRKYFLAGQPDTAWHKNDLSEQSDSTFLITDQQPDGLIASPCGRDVNIRINSHLQVDNAEGYASLNDGASIKVRWQNV